MSGSWKTGEMTLDLSLNYFFGFKPFPCDFIIVIKKRKKYFQASSGIQQQDELVPEHGEGADGGPGQDQDQKQAQAEKPLKEGSVQLLQDTALQL